MLEIPTRIKMRQITDGTTKTLHVHGNAPGPDRRTTGRLWIDRRARLWIPASSTFQISTLLCRIAALARTDCRPTPKLGCGKDIGFCIDLGAEGLPCARSNTASTYTLASRSRHPGGVSVALCDASVRFVADDVDIQIWRGFGSRAGQEIGGEL